MSHIILPIDPPISDAGALYAAYKRGEMMLEEYIARIGDHRCQAPNCIRPAGSVERAQRRCAVCALKDRNARRR